MNKHFLLIISFGFLFLGMENRIEAATISFKVSRQNLEADKALQEACKNNDLKAAELAIADGADVNTNEFDGVYPDFEELMKGNIKGPIAPYNNGLPPLIYACMNRNLEMAKMLLVKGAHINTLDKYMYTPLRVACERKDLEMIKLLIENNARVPDDLDGLSKQLIQKAEAAIKNQD